MNRTEELSRLRETVVACTRCPRLVAHRERVAREKRKAFADWTYWGRPVPGFGDPRARLVIIGLAPAAHGGNRTGRVFTGDPSAAFLMRALHRAGFASQPHSESRDDGLRLRDAYITAAVRCAPPDNRPTSGEEHACAPFLWEELDILQPRAVLALGRLAFDAFLRYLSARRGIRTAGTRFRHGATFDFAPDAPVLFASYHPSPRNTQTGRLTRAAFQSVVDRIRRVLDTAGRERRALR